MPVRRDKMADMNAVLDYLVRFCSFLWAGHRYRIVDSTVSPSFGGDCSLTVACDVLNLVFVRDRGELTLLLGAATGDTELYSVDLLRRLVTGERQYSSQLDAGYAAFLRQHLPLMESLFAPDEVARTRVRLHELQRIRAKEMFG